MLKVAFNKTAIAMLVTSTLGGGAAIAQAQYSGSQPEAYRDSVTDARANFAKLDKSIIGQYSIVLKQKAALHTSYAVAGINQKGAVNKVTKQQDVVLATIKSIDSSVNILNRTRLISNMLVVNMTAAAAEKIATNDLVSDVVLHQNSRVSSAEQEQTPGDPAMKRAYINDPGDAITVAILSTGVDYTHTAFGGAGTAEAYNEAWANSTNGWDGFPTDVIYGGFDFASEYGSLDFNPIDQAESSIDPVDGTMHDTGRGTALASIVHELAPEAKILALKTLGTKINGRVYSYHRNHVWPALELAIDPNQDGDSSDHVDILLIDSQGAGAFYQEAGQGISSPSLEIELLRGISATGALIVTNAGEWGEYQATYNLAWQAATPEALTVGSITTDGDKIFPESFSPFGPVRGIGTLKPEIMANATANVALVGSNDQTEEQTHRAISSARVAGLAAAMLAKNPQLSPAEVKALVANTADHNIMADENSADMASVARIGSGVERFDLASQTAAVAFDSSNYQPNLNFGQFDVINSKRINKEITLRNVTDSAQTYQLSVNANGDKASHSALTWQHPQTITVPANRSVSFTLDLDVNGEELAAWPFTKSTDFTLLNWDKAQLNGYLTLTNSDESVAQINLPWLAMPRAGAARVQDYSSRTLSTPNDHPEIAAWYKPVDTIMVDGSEVEFGSVNGGDVKTLAFSNESNVDQTYGVYPLMAMQRNLPESKVGDQGNHLKYMAGGVYADERCESGQRLSVAVTMHEKTATPQAEHYDRGAGFAYVTLYNEAYLDMLANAGYKAGADVEHNAKYFADSRIAHFWVGYDENGQPSTTRIDYNKEYEWWNPTGRYTSVKLPATASPNSDTAVMHLCGEELEYEHFSADMLDTYMGFQFGTDRDAIAGPKDDVVRFNPVQFGKFHNNIEIDWETYDYYESMGWNPQLSWVMTGGAYQVGTFAKVRPYLAPVELAEGEEAAEQMPWTDMITLQPGEMAEVIGTQSIECSEGSVGIGDTAGKDCLGLESTGFMLVNFAGNDLIQAQVSSYDDSYMYAIEGQGFTAKEDVVAGTVLGQIQINTDNFFEGSTFDKNWSNYVKRSKLYLVNSIPGTPFSVSEQGVITVINPDALDYEKQTQYQLMIEGRWGNSSSAAKPVTVYIQNINDNAPQLITEIPAMAAKQGNSFDVDLSAFASDLEGDGITFSSSNLPAGLIISTAGIISGTPTQFGDVSSTIKMTDGVHDTSVSLTFSIEETPGFSEEADSGSGSSGGSFGATLITLLGLGAFTRRRNIEK